LRRRQRGGVAIFVIVGEPLGELDIDFVSFVDIGGDEGSEDVEAVEDHVVVGSYCEHEIDGFLVDCRRVGFVVDVFSFGVAKYN
jgi:hypothetical protein